MILFQSGKSFEVICMQVILGYIGNFQGVDYVIEVIYIIWVFFFYYYNIYILFYLWYIFLNFDIFFVSRIY